MGETEESIAASVLAAPGHMWYGLYIRPKPNSKGKEFNPLHYGHELYD